MGSVYEVLSDDGRRLALKLLDDTSARERFLREAKAAQAIDNEHVVKTLELGIDEALGKPFLVMELLEGSDLARVLSEHAPLAPEVVARIGVQASRALGAAHAAGLVHRDVKPSNVFLHREGERLVVKLCDFGIAKRVSEIGAERASLELTRTGGFLGSPRYMSPEQAKSARRVDAKSDVWSLCVTLYEALTGTELWSSPSSLGEVIVAICTEPIAPLARVAPWVDPGLARVIERGLEREPERRWSSMQALETELERFVGGRRELVAGDLERFTPSPRPRRISTPMLALSLSLFLVGAAAAIWVSLRSGTPPESPTAESASAEPLPEVVVATRAGEPVEHSGLDAAASPPRKPAFARTPEVARSRREAEPRAPATAALPDEPRPSAAAPSAAPMLTPKDEW
jgi:serine/threonine-protein kinase